LQGRVLHGAAKKRPPPVRRAHERGIGSDKAVATVVTLAAADGAVPPAPAGEPPGQLTQQIAPVVFVHKLPLLCSLFLHFYGISLMYENHRGRVKFLQNFGGFRKDFFT
jgi:hypothetical protein